MEIRSSAPIAVVGAGTMGTGIAQVAATAGHPVTILDMNPMALDRGRAALKAALESAVAKGRLPPNDREKLIGRITWTSDLAQAAGAALVIEAIVEDLAIKRKLFGGLARVVGATTLLASNTSSLGIGQIAQQLALPSRFLGLHFFNPVPAMKLVEVIPGNDTDPAIVDAAVALMRAWGKTPVRVRDVAGFIVNRVARPYYAEAFAALAEGIDPSIIDAALTEAGGFRMGPFALADMIGHDVNYTVAVSVHDAGVGTPRFRLQPAQAILVERGALGRKAGRGVYDYAAAMPFPRYLETDRRPITIRAGKPDLLEPLIEAARAAGADIVTDALADADTINVDGVRIALGDGRMLCERPDTDVIIDHARDFRSARTLVVSGENENTIGLAAGFLQLAGRRTLVVQDRAGQLVLRTLAQLANAAADTVADRIASADDIEEAMRCGANHPEGPLAWGRRIGQDRLRSILCNLSASTGDALYAPSNLLGKDRG